MNLPRNKNLKTFARKLRREGTKGEAILWRDVLKNRQIGPISLIVNSLLENT